MLLASCGLNQQAVAAATGTPAASSVSRADPAVDSAAPPENSLCIQPKNQVD